MNPTTQDDSGSRHAAPSSTPAPGRGAFANTHWSVVLAAGRSDAPRAQAALEDLCQTYWPPLYAYVRRRGYAPEDAQDLTQAFFERLLERNAVAAVAPEKGRFRSFLLASMNHFLADEWDKARAQKRGGGRVIGMDLSEAETRLGECSSEELSPEKAFERRWAITLLEQVYRRLADEQDRAGKTKLFTELRGTLAGTGADAPYAELAQRLGLTQGAVKVAVHRLRQRYRALLRAAIADTVSSPNEAEDELRHLFRVLSGD